MSLSLPLYCMLLLGIDLGTSSVKVTVIDASNSKILATAQHPETEAAIISHHPGWAEQSPNQWWHDVKAAILKLHATGCLLYTSPSPRD